MQDPVKILGIALIVIAGVGIVLEFLRVYYKRKQTLTQEANQSEVETFPAGDNLKFGLTDEGKFEPDYELIHFAERIAHTYKYMMLGEQHSYKGNYSILCTDYEDRTPARIKAGSFKIELCKKNISTNIDYSSNYIFFLVLWCFCYAGLVQKGDKDLSKADMLTMEYYLRTGKSVSDVLKGYTSENNIVLNSNRIQQLSQFVKDYYKYRSTKA